jgi:very-short-patch-repair endonuclease/predicted transcriptional regulator of viral defense system
MKPVEVRALRLRFRDQHGLVTRRELRALGVTPDQERHRRATGEWEQPAPGVIRLAGSPRSPEQDLMVACLAASPSAVASHQSAAWMWGLLDRPPARHAVTISRDATGRSLQGLAVDVHRPVDYPAHVVTRRHIPCTNPLRSLVDLAAVATADDLDGVIDQALAIRVLTVEAIEAELRRLSRPGRAGAGRMRLALQRRGITGSPHPSVLESRTLRMLRRFGIEPLATEVRMGPDGRYRVDVVLAPTLIMEVDGFAYHAGPEQMAEDKRRRTELRLGGTTVLEYTWRDITYNPERVIREVRLALSAAAGSMSHPGGRLHFR